MFDDLSFIIRAACASVLGSGCMLAALMWTQDARETNSRDSNTKVVSLHQDTERDNKTLTRAR
jgi:hypothetical protein